MRQSGELEAGLGDSGATNRAVAELEKLAGETDVGCVPGTDFTRDTNSIFAGQQSVWEVSGRARPGIELNFFRMEQS